MADVSSLMAEMLARSRPQQAPSPGHVPVMSGGGPGGASFGKDKQVGAQIDIGAIQRFFSADDKAKDESLNQLQAVYNDLSNMGDEESIKARDAMFDNPMVQHRMREGYEAGKPGIVEVPEKVVPAGTSTTTDPNAAPTPDYNKIPSKYVFAVMAGSEQRQKEQTMAKQAPEEKKKMFRPASTTQGILSTQQGTKEEREALINAQQRIEAAGRPPGEAKPDKLVENALQNFALVQKQTAIQQDPLTPKEPKVKFADNMKLMAAASNTVKTIRARTGSYHDAMGPIASVTAELSNEMSKPTTTQEEHEAKKEYLRQYSGLLKNSAITDDLRPYATLADWALKMPGAKGSDVRLMLKKEFGMQDRTKLTPKGVATIDDIIEMTQTYKDALYQESTPPPPIEEPKSGMLDTVFGGYKKLGSKALNWWDKNVEQPVVNKVKGNK